MHNALILHYHEAVAGKNEIVSAEELTAQLALVKKLKMPVVSLEEMVENDYQRKRWHRHVVLITCTDTFLAQNPTVFQTLKDTGFPVTVFISVNENSDPEQSKRLQEFVAAGFSIGLHSVLGVLLNKISDSELQRNLSEAKQKLESETGQPVRFLLPSSGDLNQKQVLIVRELGFDAVLTHKVGFNKFNADLFHLKTWTVPAHTSLKAFEQMLCREKRELLVQEMKVLQNGSKLWQKSPFGKLKGLFRKVLK